MRLLKASVVFIAGYEFLKGNYGNPNDWRYHRPNDYIKPVRGFETSPINPWGGNGPKWWLPVGGGIGAYDFYKNIPKVDTTIFTKPDTSTVYPYYYYKQGN